MIKSNTIIDTLHNSPSIILLKESKQSSPDYSFLIPLLAALAGGIIVLIGQNRSVFQAKK